MSAREMFEDLNFMQIVNNDTMTLYKNIDNPDFYIEFDNIYKTISGYQTYDYVCNYKMLKAINKQVEELGWNERF